MNENVIELIKFIVLVLPIAGLIWKLALLAAQVKEDAAELKQLKGTVADYSVTMLQVKQNEKDIAEVRDRTAKQADRILVALDTINKTMQDLRVEVSTLKAMREAEQLLKEDTKHKKGGE